MEARGKNPVPKPNPNFSKTSWVARKGSIVEDEQKLKRLKIKEDKDEERDENKIPPLLITSAEASRIAKLKRILKVLKGIDTSLLNSHLLLIPTLDEQRIYKLISCHLGYCIFLFNRESFCSQILQQQQQQQQESLPPNLTTIPFAHIDDDIENQENLKDLKANELYFPLQLDDLIELLKECRHPITGSSNEESTFLHPHCELYKRQLLVILFDLEEMARSREYAPPNHGREIECYQEIQKLVTLFLTRLEALVGFARGIYPLGSPIRRNLVGKFYHDDMIHHPPGYKLALALDLIPQTRLLLERYKRHLSCVFSNDDIYESYGCDCEIDSGGVDDGVDLDLVKQSSEAVMKSRIDCLRIIVSKFEQIGELPCDPVPTIKEVRLYAQIAAHVHPAIWLSKTVKEAERNTCSGCHEVNVASVVDLSCSSSGDNTSIRESYLLEIVSYFRAMRSSYAIAVPTSEELECYTILSKRLSDNLFPCSLSPEHDGVERSVEIKPQVVSDEVILALTHQLDFIHRSKLKFFVRINELCASIMYMVRGFAMSTNYEHTEDLSFEVADSWLIDNRGQFGDRLKEIIREIPEGRIDRVIVILEEIASSVCNIWLMLVSATEFVDRSLSSEKYEIVAAEVHNALFIMDKIKHLISETI